MSTATATAAPATEPVTEKGVDKVREAEIFVYGKEARFGVVKKLPKADRFKCDFRFLHPSREAAEKEAIRLTTKHGHKFYIVEIVGITNFSEGF